MSYGLLKGKKGIIFGALNNQSIAWKVAERCHEEGAEFILSNAPIAMRMGELDDLAAQTGSEIIPADASSMEDLEKLFARAEEKFGKLDFILHSIGMSVNIRKGKAYTDLNYDFLEKGWDVSAVSFHKVMKTAWDKNIMNEWGSILALTYIAAQRTFPNYSDMADNKSYLESIARSFGYFWGERKVRVNTISQSPVMTKAGAGVKGIEGFFNFADDMSPLGNADAVDCANYCVSMFSDLTRKVTMQNLFHDGGFSNTGVSNKIIEKFE
ncbi:enoyl-ACP reductase FabI [Frigoriflavimonas asaccharolytica]|uniref:Enoyl-[acyl-carrier-protein] reductase [NADH] n=1 Tax=Frigoriflavimonas asaccharolytica TaxID=2735899 RepID=A0A8J8G8D7_9FLAO|nr:SDR family oxidoreductase [Frigoriflavimonas asaccharolytica]NRS93023.1 enoyl-[acyl-carrier protein] reductase I [Frigoriflavimonas asaccharolytica]